MDKQRIDERLDALIPLQEGSCSLLFEAARYSLLSPGKRIRPRLLLGTVRAFGQEISSALDPACALEMVHAYSLIHDDLPCIDDDATRRGLPTLHIAYPEGHALLTGDFLLTKSFEVLANAPLLSDQQKVLLIRELAMCSGAEGMVGGQVMDLSQEEINTKELHAKKTGALFRASFTMSAIILNLSSELKQKVGAFGDLFGLLFQTVDDLLDGDHPDGEESAYALLEETKEKAFTALEALPLQGGELKEMLTKVLSSINTLKAL